jgi:hypothetical protein
MKLKSFCTTKDMVSKLKRMGENLCLLYIRQGTDNQNIQEAQKTKFPKNNPMKKWANEPNRTIPKEEVQMTKKHMKKWSPI